MRNKPTSNTAYIVAALTIFIVVIMATSPASATEARCLVDASANIDIDDALTVADVVCQDVRAHGVSVGSPSSDLDAAGPSGTYRVKLRALGGVTVLTLSHEDASGAVLRSEHLQLNGLEEVITLSPRLAESITQSRAIAETATITTLDHAATREYEKAHGEFLWGASVGGTIIPYPFLIAPGAALNFVYEMPDAALTSRTAFFVADQNGDDAAGFSFSLGGRKLFGQSNTALFAGGGLGWSVYHADKHENNSDYTRSSGQYFDGNGVEAYAEAGVEMFRFHKARVLFDARLSLPLYGIEKETWEDGENPDGTWYYDEDMSNTYITPVTFGATVLW